MKEKKLNVYLTVLIAASLLMCAYDFFKGYIASYVNTNLPLGASLVVGTLHILLWAAYALFFVVTVVLLFLKLLRGKAWIILTLALTAVFLIFVRSGVYAELYHSAFRAEREAVIDSMLSGDVSGYTQTDENEYYTGDIRISNSAEIDMFEHEGERIFVFDVWRSTLARRLLIYVENGGDLDDGFKYYDHNITDVKDLSDGWYSCKVER